MSQAETEVRAAGAARRWDAEAPDDAVLERVRAGETAPYEVLVHRYNPRLRCAVRGVLSNEADVEDVVQETHYNALRFIRQYSGRSSLITWLTRIAINAALSRFRRRAYSHELSPTSTGQPAESVSPQRDPEQQFQDKEMSDTLEAAVQALPESYRAVLLLRRFEELSTSEVAVLLEISEGCAKSRLYRAQKLLRSRLRERWSHYALPRYLHSQ